jgi:phosphohistidine phosphatase SixA
MLVGAGIALLSARAIAQDPPKPVAAPAVSPPSAPQAAKITKARTFVLVRHAEKLTDDPKDPALSEAGRARAAALAKLLGSSGITHILTSEYKRAKETAEPLAKALAMEPTVHPARDAIGLADRLMSLPEGSIALVIGHSNTLPVVARAVGASLRDLQQNGDLRDDEYDRVSVLSFFAPDEASRGVGTFEFRY